MSFKLFEYLDLALIDMETNEAYASRSARIWPSEASANLIQISTGNIVGACHRKTFYRLTGEKTTSNIDAIAARRFRTGRAVEDDTTLQAIEATLHIASGVRVRVPQLDMNFELDLVVLDPSSLQAVICENKSIFGYQATTQIMGNTHKEGKPKLEHLIQILIYLNEIRTGGHIKKLIEAGMADKINPDRTGRTNRIEVTKTNLDMIPDDSKVYGKLCYETRDTCVTHEFDIDIYEEFDGTHYPLINGKVWKIFTIESIYERFDKIQAYFNQAQKEAIRRLDEQEVKAPIESDYDEAAEPGFKGADNKYWDRVAEEMRRLPLDYLPPADYQFRYSDNKIEDLFSKKLISETKYKEWKTWKAGRRRKAGTPIIGDYQCTFCNYRLPCIAIEYPDLKPVALDLMSDL